MTSPATPDSAPVDLPAAAIGVEQLRLLAERHRSLVGPGLIGLVVVVLVQVRSEPWWTIAGYAALRLAVILRNYLLLRDVLRVGPQAAHARGDLARLEWALCHSGWSWGLAAWLLDEPLLGNAADMLLALILVAVTGVMVSATYVTRRALLMLTAPLWGLILLRLLLSDSAIALPMIGVAAVYLAVLADFALHLHRQLCKGIEAELRSARLAAALLASQQREEAQRADLARANEQLQQALAQAEELASHDALTGVLNRRAFIAQAQRMAAARMRDQRLALLMIDLDLFKSINDRFGHAAGDRALTAVARCMQAELREDDVLGRWGGEEFVVLLARADAAQAGAAAERLRAAVAAAPLPELPARVTISVGVAPIDRERSLDAALEAADAALYRAKQAGRDRIELAVTPPADRLPPAISQPQP